VERTADLIAKWQAIGFTHGITCLIVITDTQSSLYISNPKKGIASKSQCEKMGNQRWQPRNGCGSKNLNNGNLDEFGDTKVGFEAFFQHFIFLVCRKF